MSSLLLLLLQNILKLVLKGHPVLSGLILVSVPRISAKYRFPYML